MRAVLDTLATSPQDQPMPTNAHAHCTHPATKAARAACRRLTQVAGRNAALPINADAVIASLPVEAAPAPIVDHAAARHTALDASKELGFTKLGRDDMPGVFPDTSCRGINHSDTLHLGYCDSCGARVTRTHRRTLIDNWNRFCFGNAHTCDPERVAAHQAEREALLASGTIVKGARVIVARGRKVAKGTEGVVFWLGTDSYGKAKLGLRTDEGDTHFTAASNVDLV